MRGRSASDAVSLATQLWRRQKQRQALSSRMRDGPQVLWLHLGHSPASSPSSLLCLCFSLSRPHPGHTPAFQYQGPPFQPHPCLPLPHLDHTLASVPPSLAPAMPIAISLSLSDLRKCRSSGVSAGSGPTALLMAKVSGCAQHRLPAATAF